MRKLHLRVQDKKARSENMWKFGALLYFVVSAAEVHTEISKETELQNIVNAEIVPSYYYILMQIYYTNTSYRNSGSEIQRRKREVLQSLYTYLLSISSTDTKSGNLDVHTAKEYKCGKKPSPKAMT